MNKRKLIQTLIYLICLLLMIGIPIIRYYVSSPGINACVLDYVDNLEESDFKGIMYDIDGIKHIEPANSKNIKSLERYKIGESNGCLMASNNLFNDLNNTFYCTVTYLIKNAPISDKLKEPLDIMKQ